MRAEPRLRGRDWSHDSDRDSVTEIYEKPPSAPPGAPRFTPSVRSFEIPARDERLTIPALPTPARWPERTNGMRRGPSAFVKLAFAVGCILVGIAIGGAIALRGSSGARAKIAPAPAPAATEPVAPIARPTVVPVTPSAAEPAPVKTRVTVRIESEPSGATAMLIDDGRTSLVGTTPVDTEVDPSRTYDVVLTLADRAPSIERFDPARGNRVRVVLAPVPTAAR